MEQITYLSINSGIIRILLLAVTGYFLVKMGIFSEQGIKQISRFLIQVCIPCLFFSHLIENFSPSTVPSIGIFLIISLALFLAGLIMGISLACLSKDKELAKETTALLSFQNSGYLPMNIVFFTLTNPLRDRLLSYIFLYLLGFNILMWSVGSFFIFKNRNDKLKLAGILTPPVIAIILSVLIKYLFPQARIPQVIFEPVRMIGQMSFVLSMIVLGGGLYRISLSKINLRFISRCISISSLKLILLPLIVILIIIKYKIFGAMGLFLILESSMPSAVSLPIVVEEKNRDYSFTSQMVFLSHLFSCVTIPFWINMFIKISK